MIRGTFCDLAVKLSGELALLVEVKAIGLDLREQFVKQAVDYAANQGCEWVALTTGLHWRVYKVQFAKPIATELVVEFNLLDLNPRVDASLELLWLLAKEGWQKARLGEYAAQRQALSRFSIAAVVLTAPVMDVIRRQLRRISPDVRIDTEQIEGVLRRRSSSVRYSRARRRTRLASSWRGQPGVRFEPVVPRMRLRRPTRSSLRPKSLALTSTRLESHALGSASTPTALNRAHPMTRRLHSPASIGVICPHSSRTLSNRNTAAESSGDIEAMRRSVA